MQIPAIDADGNDIAGVRAPMVEAPLGTYTGWNLRREGEGEGAMYLFTGATIPFAATASTRRMTGDPRASVEERYADADAYVQAIHIAARRLVEAGLLLEEDFERIKADAANWDSPRHTVRLD